MNPQGIPIGIGDKSSTRSRGIISDHSNDSHADDLVLSEILTRLPVKSLTRFKIVCKRWYSLIQKDEHFIDLHITRSKTRSPCRLFIIAPVPKITKEEFYITADLFIEDDKGCIDVVVDTVRKIDSSSCYSTITKPVNGLICVIDTTCSHDVRIYNISTGEVSPLIESSLSPLGVRFDGFGRTYYYQLGFDLVTNEHKLVCVREMQTLTPYLKSYVMCEVLTIGRHGVNGDNRWRRIDGVPEYKLSEDSVYVNGFIYWCTNNLASGLWHYYRPPYRPPLHLVEFDVSSEKFRTITVPDFILNHPYYILFFNDTPNYATKVGHVDLLEIDGRLAMLIRTSNCVFKMYLFEDDYTKEDITRVSTSYTSGLLSNNGSWTEVSISLPFNLREEQQVRFHTFAGSDDTIMLTCRTKSSCNEEAAPNLTRKCVSCYYYNWKKGIWTEFKVNGIPSSVPHLCIDSFLTTFSESLLAVNNHNASLKETVPIAKKKRAS